MAKVSAEHGGKEVSSIRFIKDGKGFNSMILFYKELEHFEINLRAYALKDEWYETISEKLFGEEQYKSITIDELIKNYDSDVFDTGRNAVEYTGTFDVNTLCLSFNNISISSSFDFVLHANSISSYLS